MPLPAEVLAAEGYTFEDLCRVRTIRRWNDTGLVTEQAVLKPGVLLARNGSWQHKYIIRHIEQVAESTPDTYHGWRTKFTVCVQFLGRFFADGRMFPANKVIEVESEELIYGDPPVIGSNISYYAPVVPAFKPLKSVEISQDKKKFKAIMSGASELMKLEKQGSVGMQQLISNPTINVTAKPADPAAILDQFLM